MVTLRAVLRMPGLGLEQIAGDPSPDVDVRWAHVSELDDPTPWLEGGELLLTTGLSADWSETGALGYCERLVDRGVVALGASVGPDLAHPAIPEPLRAAAETTGLRLIRVPNGTPLQSVVRAVADAISAVNARPLRALVEIQQALMSEAASGSGLPGLVERLRRDTRIEVAVFDVRLRLASETGPADAWLDAEARQRIRRILLTDTRGAISIESPGMSLIVLPLANEGRPRGFVVARRATPFTPDDRAMLKNASAILGLLLEVRESTVAPERGARALLAKLLLSGQVPPDQLAAAASAARVQARTVRVIRVRTQSAAQRRAFLAGMCEVGADAIAVNEDDQTAVIVIDPIEDFVERLRALADELDMNDLGVGDPASMENAARSHTEAIRAQAAAGTRGVRVMTSAEQGGKLRGILLADRERLIAYSDSVLRPIDDHDRANPRQELLPTLRAYFDAIGSLEAAAAALQIHRHTMRARLRRASEVSGYDVTVASQYLELWLAVELRYDPPKESEPGER